MNELQKAEFELLKIFTEICEKLNLKYYLVCGTALGAVKYGGFIPWDDDIDVALPREDYEKFISGAQIMLPDGIFLQNYKTDPKFPQIFSKLRNSETTYIEESVSELDINHGIFIDIFPLDGYPTSKSAAKRLEFMKKLRVSQLLSVCKWERGLKGRIIRAFWGLIGCRKNTAAIAAKTDRMLASYPAAESEIWCNHGNWQGILEYTSRDEYGEGADATFEGLSVKIPEKFDEYFTQKYGDWRADPPEDKRNGHHFYTVCDTEKPYTQYIKKEQKRNEEQ